MKLHVCLVRQGSLRSEERLHRLSLPGHVTPAKSGNQKPKTAPLTSLPPRKILLKIPQLTRKEVKRRATFAESSKFHFSELLATNDLDCYIRKTQALLKQIFYPNF